MIWKDIKGFEGCYQVSNSGEIRSLDKFIGAKGNTKRLIKGRTMKLQKSQRGHLCVTLKNNGLMLNTFAHRLLAIAFIPNPENKPCINHINGIKEDNRIENLEWCTVKENTDHAYKNELKHGLIGDNNPSAKLTKEKVLEIRSKGKYTTFKNLAEYYNVSQSTIASILKNKTWKNL